MACVNFGSNVRKFSTHYKCRNGIYPKSPNIRRFFVPDDKVSWETEWNQYQPVEYTSKNVLNQPWADPSLNSNDFRPLWNALDGLIDRRSLFTQYRVESGRPVNPIGRTGLIGRGCLGRWGPNHAADPIVTRWKRNEINEVYRDPQSQKPVLQFVAIERRDSREWAIPGGMVDPGERVSNTLKREFMEEALNSLDKSSQEVGHMKGILDEFFNSGIEIYRGYVDDPRNTDNAWMETVATNFHDEHGSVVGSLELSAGDDAANVQWMDISSSLSLYASHSQLIYAVVERLNGSW